METLGPGIQGQLYLGHRVNNRPQENMEKFQSGGKVKVVLVN